MNKVKTGLLLFCGLLFISQTALAYQELEVGAEEPTELRSLSNQLIQVPPKQGHLVLCFLGTECPLAKLYAPRLDAMATEFSERGFQFVAINSNRQDSTDEWRQFAEAAELKLPLVKDYENQFADRWNVIRNPEVIVVATDGSVPYRGRIDDQYLPGIVRPKVNREDLRLALNQIAAGEAVSVPVTKPEGCLIGRIKKPLKKATVTYARDIAPIFKQNCIDCHRPGQIGPFAMVDYDEVVGWADMIVESIDNGRMPPWHADSSVGTFANARRLSEQQKQLIQAWVDQGAQLGDPSQLPEPKQFTTGWRLPRNPDQVVAMRDKPYQVPADGTVEYQYFVVDPGFQEDKWVSAAEIIPGNRSVVHHSIVFIRPPDGQRALGLNWLEAYVPGQVPVQHVPTRARKIPAGSKLVFQQHYTPNGKPQQDLTKIGLIFVDEEQVQEQLVTLAAINQEFEIRPYQSAVTVKAKISYLPPGGKLLSIAPHMHYRGKSFVAKAVDDDSEQVLLSVPSYDFNWQHNYEFTAPRQLKDLESLEMEVTFDNSKDNPFNPDPSQFVVWGDQTWEEMAVGFFNISIPRQPTSSTKSQPDSETSNSSKTAVRVYSDETLRRAAAYTEMMFQKNDANNDGKLVQEEMQLLPGAIFPRLDTDQNGIATKDEVEKSARDVYNFLEFLNK